MPIIKDNKKQNNDLLDQIDFDPNLEVKNNLIVQKRYFESIELNTWRKNLQYIEAFLCIAMIIVIDEFYENSSSWSTIVLEKLLYPKIFILVLNLGAMFYIWWVTYLDAEFCFRELIKFHKLIYKQQKSQTKHRLVQTDSDNLAKNLGNFRFWYSHI